MPGIFITFEGIEGSGKSTQLARLASRLRLQGRAVETTREPGGTIMGDKIRSLLLDVRHTDLRPKAELLLYLAGRSQHLQTVIQPNLAKGMIILCDRFSDATIAYQGFGRGLRKSPDFQRLIRYAADGLQPDLTLLLDLDPRTALARVANRGEINRIDRETLTFHTRVRRGYRELARRAPRRITVINAKRPEDDVAGQIERIVFDRLRRPSAARRPLRTGAAR
jgi:dTMP kinase